MKYNLHRLIYPALIFMIALMSCAGPEKLIQQGRYEEALDGLIRRLDRGKITAEKVAWLQEAYNRHEPVFTRRITPFLSGPGRSSQLEGTLSEVNLVIRQQQQIEQIRYRIEGSGFSISTLSIDTLLNWKDRILDRLTDAYKVETDALMVQARDGDKYAAREVYDLFRKWYQLEPDRSDLTDAIEESRELGTNHILLIVADHRTPAWTDLPVAWRSDVPAQLINNWTSLHFQDDPILYDFVLYLDVDRWSIGPERISEQKHHAQQRVIDGYRVRRDTAGNAVFDSLGHAIKDPVWITASARIVEVIKSREAVLHGSLELRDESNGAIVWSHPVDLYQQFNNQFARYQGDIRALTSDEKRLVDNPEVPFPNNRDMEANIWSDLMRMITAGVSKLPVNRIS